MLADPWHRVTQPSVAVTVSIASAGRDGQLGMHSQEIEMSDSYDEMREVRGQRHDFIKEYYKMAVADLDRHLKGGWQTIAVLAGGAAVLTVGHDGKMPIPLSVSIALFIAFWGMLNVLDANYWALRAIAF